MSSESIPIYFRVLIIYLNKSYFVKNVKISNFLLNYSALVRKGLSILTKFLFLHCKIGNRTQF